MSLQTKYVPTIKPSSSTASKMCFLVEGPPGTGKSTLCGSLAEYVGADKTLLIATLAREIESWKYKALNVPHVLLQDANWKPDAGQFLAEGFPEFLRLMRWLRDEDDQFEAVILDSGTELAEQAWHLALSPMSVSSPAQIEGRSRWLPYETLTNNLDQAIKELVTLTTTAKVPKHVAVTWHVQPPKDDQVVEGVKKESADHAAKGVEYEGDVLPMVRGQYRRKLGSQFPTVVYTDILVKANMGLSQTNARSIDVEYRLQVRPSVERHTKLSGPLPEAQFIKNDFKELLKLVQQSSKAAPAPAASLSRK
jgi:AAA domain